MLIYYIIFTICIVAGMAYSVGYVAGKASRPKLKDIEKEKIELWNKIIQMDIDASKIWETDPAKALSMRESANKQMDAYLVMYGPSKALESES